MAGSRFVAIVALAAAGMWLKKRMGQPRITGDSSPSAKDSSEVDAPVGALETGASRVPVSGRSASSNGSGATSGSGMSGGMASSGLPGGGGRSGM